MPAAHNTPMSAPVDMVVTEMNTPSSTLVRAPASETRPTIPAGTATTPEKQLGVSIGLDTGLTSSSKAFGCSLKPPTRRAKRKVVATASKSR